MDDIKQIPTITEIKSLDAQTVYDRYWKGNDYFRVDQELHMFDKYLHLSSKYTNIPEIKALVSFYEAIFKGNRYKLSTFTDAKNTTITYLQNKKDLHLLYNEAEKVYYIIKEINNYLQKGLLIELQLKSKHQIERIEDRLFVEHSDISLDLYKDTITEYIDKVKKIKKEYKSISIEKVKISVKELNSIEKKIKEFNAKFNVLYNGDINKLLDASNREIIKQKLVTITANHSKSVKEEVKELISTLDSLDCIPINVIYKEIKMFLKNLKTINENNEENKGTNNGKVSIRREHIPEELPF